MTYLLNTRYDRRASFYGKALVEERKNITILTSYNTQVAIIKNNKAYINGTYSNTTLRHIKEFLKQNGFKAESKKQIIEDYFISDFGFNNILYSEN